MEPLGTPHVTSVCANEKLSLYKIFKRKWSLEVEMPTDAVLLDMSQDSNCKAANPRLTIIFFGGDCLYPQRRSAGRPWM